MSQQPAEQLDKQKLQAVLSRNLFISIFSRFYQVIIRVFIPPLILSFISIEEYGIWALCFVLINYLSLGAFGVSNVYVRYVAEYHAKSQITHINGLLSTGITLVSGITGVLLVGFWFLIPWLISNLFTIDPRLHDTATIFFMTTAVIFLFQLSMGAFNYVLEGLQKITHSTIINLICLTIETILIIILLFNGWGIYALLYAFITRYTLSIISFIAVSYYVIPGLSISPKYFSRDFLNIFYRYGSIVQIAGFLGVFIHSFARFFAGTIDIKAAGILDIGMKFPIMAATISGSMNTVYLPTASYLHSQQRKRELLQMYVQGSRFIGLLTGYFMGFMAAFATPLMLAWLGSGQNYSIAATILGLYTVAQQLHIMTGPGSAFFNGIAQPSRNLVYSLTHISMLGISTLAAYLVYGSIELMTLVIVATFSMSSSALFYNLYINYVIGLSFVTFLRKVLLPSFISYALGLITLSIWTVIYMEWLGLKLNGRWEALHFVFWGGFIYTILIGLTIYFIVLSSSEKQIILNKLEKINHFVTSKLK